MPLLPRSLHYGWVIVVTGALVLFSCLGLARYAYTMLLPGMRADLGYSYSAMGVIGTANFIGYLAAVLLVPLLLKRFRPRLLIAAGLIVVACSMLVLGIASSFTTILVAYVLAGVGGGVANIPLMALVTYWFRSDVRGRAAGLIIGGNGGAIVFAGVLIPLLNRVYGGDGWRYGWLVLGCLSLAIAAVAGLLLRNSPAEVGLEPLGRPPAPPKEQLLTPPPPRGGLLLRLGLLYFAFGATFMVYGTFIVSTLVGEYGYSEAAAGGLWSWVGGCSLFSGVGFGALSDRIGRRSGLAIVFVVQCCAYALVGSRLGGVALILSIILYGSAVFAIPSIMAAAVGDYLGPARAAPAFATVTIFFAAGQTLGPAVAGAIAGATGSFAPAYLGAAALTALAAVGATRLPRPTAV